MRNKQIIKILDLLHREGIIAGYEMPKKFYYNHSGELMLGKKLSNYYTPVKIIFKDGPRPYIKTVGSPGKRMNYTFKKLDRVWRKVGSSAHIFVSSARLKKICNASELIPLGEGGTPICIVHYEGAFNI